MVPTPAAPEVNTLKNAKPEAAVVEEATVEADCEKVVCVSE